MKNYKKISVLIISVLVVIFIGCEEDNSKKCLERTDTAIDDINCGGKNCHCLPKVYGNIASIPIYREKNVTNEQAISATENIISGYNDKDPSLVANINTSKVSAIHITIPEKVDCLPDGKGKFIIYLAYNENSGNMGACLAGVSGWELNQ